MVVRMAADNHPFCLHLFGFPRTEVQLSPERFGIANFLLEKMPQDPISEAPIQDEIQ